MTNSKNTEFERGLKVVSLALALDDLLNESARKGVAQIAAMSDDEIARLIADSERLPAHQERGSRFSIPFWQGLLATLNPMQPVAAGALADNRGSARRAGIKIDLKDVLGDKFDHEDFAWASGPLRIEAVYSDVETVLSLRISVRLRKSVRESGRPLLIELTDIAHRRETVRLGADTPSVTVDQPTLTGALVNWTLAIYVAELLRHERS